MGEKTVKNIVYLIEQEGFSVNIFNRYSRYFIDFNHSEITIGELRKIIDYIPAKYLLFTRPNGKLSIDTKTKVV